MKTILVLITIFTLGLYSCGDESTNPTPKPNEEIKKYTLEEILADSNWVEITDTLHYKKLELVTKYRNSKLKDSILYIITNENEFQNLKQYTDSISIFHKPDDFISNIDFNKQTLILAKTKFYSIEIIDKMIFINHSRKEYYYFVKIYLPLEGGIRMNYNTGNMLLIPKIKENYKFRLSILDGGLKSIYD